NSPIGRSSQGLLARSLPAYCFHISLGPLRACRVTSPAGIWLCACVRPAIGTTPLSRIDRQAQRLNILLDRLVAAINSSASATSTTSLNTCVASPDVGHGGMDLA